MFVWVKRALWVILAILVFGQAIRPSRTNPPINPPYEFTVVSSVPPATAAIFSRACNDCHSNRTIWPWYSKVAPSSWLVVYDVRAGRKEMNLSEWGTYTPKRQARLTKEICQEVTEGEMPGSMYPLMHPQAKLSSEDVQSICAWTQAEQARIAR